MLQLLRDILSLGFIGTVITAAVLVWRARVQPIHYDVDVLQVNMDPSGSIKTVVTLPDGDNLPIQTYFITRLTLINNSNKDLEQFDFGVTMPPGLTAIDVDIVAPDRSHTAEILKDSARDKSKRPSTMEEAGDALLEAMDRMDNPRPRSLISASRPSIARCASRSR